MKSLKAYWGSIGLVVLACIPCCLALPVAAPLVAWLGAVTLGAAATEEYLCMAGIFLLGLGGFLIFRRHQITVRQKQAAAGQCDCATNCNVESSCRPASHSH
ncbi:MAG: hypothetical protein V4805_04260 [Pseudomonadota bacterium]